MTEEKSLVLKNDVAELERVMTFISGLCARHSISPDIEYDLNLALDEVVTNVAKHGYPQGGEHVFTVLVTLDEDEFMARIEDDGVPFDPIAHPLPDLDAPLDARKQGGLGVFLVRQIMTSVEYERTGGMNRLTLRKKLR